MRALPVQIEGNGTLKVSSEFALPPNARLAVLVLDPSSNQQDVTSADLAALAASADSFKFLDDEPDLYTDADIEPGHQNPDFAGNAKRR